MTINEVNNIVYGGYAVAPSGSVSLTEQYLSSLEGGSLLVRKVIRERNRETAIKG